MTRLTTADIQEVPGSLERYDDVLRAVTGMDLRGLACRAYRVDAGVLGQLARRTKVGVVPVAWGLGVIEGFSETVARIAAHLGFEAFVSRAPNVAGLCEAMQRRAAVVMLSDDDCFAAINRRTGRSVDNSAATGRIFAHGLDLMAGGVAGRSVLVIGCGPVGCRAGFILLDLGAELSVVDLDPQKARDFAKQAGRKHQNRVRVARDLETALSAHDCILDASNTGAFISRRHLSGNTLIAAPGVPLGLDDGGLAAAAGRLLHDPLQLGVAAMLVGAVRENLSP